MTICIRLYPCQPIVFEGVFHAALCPLAEPLVPQESSQLLATFHEHLGI